MKTGQIPNSNYDYFLHADTSAYKGEWIAIAKKKIVAHGKNAKNVYEQAQKKLPHTHISLAKVPNEQVLVLPFSS